MNFWTHFGSINFPPGSASQWNVTGLELGPASFLADFVACQFVLMWSVAAAGRGAWSCPWQRFRSVSPLQRHKPQRLERPELPAQRVHCSHTVTVSASNPQPTNQPMKHPDVTCLKHNIRSVFVSQAKPGCFMSGSEGRILPLHTRLNCFL